MFGELIPRGGGDPIPLLKETLSIGRRESADIVLRFPNVSASHCSLTLEAGYWYVEDSGSSNGTKVNGLKVKRQRIAPGDTLAVAKHEFTLQYEPARLGAKSIPADLHSLQQHVFGRTLLQRTGLESKTRDPPPSQLRP